MYEAIIPRGTPIAKHKATDTRTDERVIIECVQIPQAPINNNKSAAVKANLNPTVK